MADIAVVFHWSPGMMAELTLSELMDWRERARLRSNMES
jgi:hypothetical protein